MEPKTDLNAKLILEGLGYRVERRGGYVECSDGTVKLPGIQRVRFTDRGGAEHA